jgi:hypothetical protein
MGQVPPDGKRDAYDWATLAIGLVGVVVVAWSTVIAALNTELVKDQISIMRSQDRPWVTADIQLEHYGVDIHDDQMEVFVEAKLKNVGQIVATNVISRHRILIIGGTDDFQRKTIEGAQVEICKDADNSVGGTSIFPGQEAKTHWVLSRSMTAEFPRSAVNLVVVGCVTYNFFDSDEAHTTPFAFKLTRKVTTVEKHPGVTITTTTDGQPFQAQTERTLPQRIAVDRHDAGNAGVS